MAVPARQTKLTGRHALVDDIAFTMPVASRDTPALMAAFSIDAERARALIPGNEIHPLRVWNRAVLVVTVVNYRITNIGKYIEYSIAIACTHGSRAAPRFAPLLLQGLFGTGQYVWDLPVSTQVSVKGGKGIWGMPKHQANLDFVIGERWVSSQYDLDGDFMMRIDVKKPARAWLPVSLGAVNYCCFRGMLFKSYIYFGGKMGFSLFSPDSARLVIGSNPHMNKLRALDISPTPLFAAYFPSTEGVLDDHFECWFSTDANPIDTPMQGMESVIDLGQSQDWLSPPNRPLDWETRDR